MKEPESTRAPSQFELEVFARLTEQAFPGRDELNQQLAQAQVSVIDEEGSIRIQTNTNKRAMTSFRVPVEAYGKDTDGVEIHFLLHVINGLVDELEIYKDDGSPIHTMPSAKTLDLIVYPITG